MSLEQMSQADNTKQGNYGMAQKVFQKMYVTQLWEDTQEFTDSS